jgi:hypothetical protein
MEFEVEGVRAPGAPAVMEIVNVVIRRFEDGHEVLVIK